MTGTSIDALDAALLQINGRALEMKAKVVRTHSVPLGPLADRLRAAATGQVNSAAWFAELAHDLGERHAQAIAALANGQRLDLAVVHGQTIHHSPPISWQLINPWPIVTRFGCQVVTDLRGADLALSGQGAPITPLADWVLLRGEGVSRAVVNLGGFCNITLLPAHAQPDGVLGFDVCACNQLLDEIARLALRCPYDDGGRAALCGTPDMVAQAELTERLQAQASADRSLGTGDEAFFGIEQWRDRLAPEDLAAAASEAIGSVIGSAIVERQTTTDELILAGGGAHHARLTQAISRAANIPLRSITDLGLTIESREAACMAVLGALAQDGVPISLAGVTGRTESPICHGAWFD